MKRFILATSVLLFALSGCSTGVNTKADGSESQGGGDTESAKIGQPVTIMGNEDGSKLQVVAKRILPTQPADEFSTVEQGNRLVAVRFSMVNTGTVAYNDAPSNGAKVVDKQGQQYEADITFQKIKAGPMLPASVKLAPKNRALGFLTFQVPKGAKIAQVQFSMDSGFGDTAQWNVK